MRDCDNGVARNLNLSRRGFALVADNDGVVVIPRLQARNVIGRLSYVRAAESALEVKVKAGLEIPDFIQSVLASDRILEID